MTQRLPPQPVDTALARAVRRLIDRLPGASIGTRRHLEEHLEYSRKVERLALAEATCAKREAYERAREMSHMAHEFAKAKGIPFPSIGILQFANADNPLTGERGHRISVSFKPVCVEFRLPNDTRGNGSAPLDDMLRRYLQDASDRLARIHAEDLRTLIFNHVCRCCGLDNLREGDRG